MCRLRITAVRVIAVRVTAVQVTAVWDRTDQWPENQNTNAPLLSDHSTDPATPQTAIKRECHGRQVGRTRNDCSWGTFLLAQNAATAEEPFMSQPFGKPDEPRLSPTSVGCCWLSRGWGGRWCRSDEAQNQCVAEHEHGGADGNGGLDPIGQRRWGNPTFYTGRQGEQNPR